jgi:ethanolamine utilization microcompartment shell protein EutL
MIPSQILEPEWVLPFEGMQVGDSFFIPTLRPSELIYSIDCGAKRAKVRVKSYVTTKDNQIGVRTWRIG